MTTATEMVELYTQAEISVLKGQSVRMGDRQLTKADLAEIRAGRAEWEAKVSRARRGGVFKAADFSRGCE